MKKNLLKLSVLTFIFIVGCESNEIETQSPAATNQPVLMEESKTANVETTSEDKNATSEDENATARTITVNAAAWTKKGAISKALAKLGNATNKRIINVYHMWQYPLWSATATGTVR